VVVYRSEDLLWSYDQAHHLPDGHLKVHLRELEQALEEARHVEALITRRRRAAECRRGCGVVPWEGDVRIHGVQEDEYVVTVASWRGEASGWRTESAGSSRRMACAVGRG
jgi:hypothetical protein